MPEATEPNYPAPKYPTPNQPVVTIDPNAFAQAFMEALPESISKLQVKMQQAQANGIAIGPEHFAALDALTDIKNGFCSLWPAANQELDNIEWWIGKIRPHVVAVMNAAEAAINKLIYTPLCGVDPATGEPAKPAVKSNVSQKARP